MYTNRGFGVKKEVPTVDLPQCPTDSVSDIAFNLENTHLGVSSWDGSVTVYQMSFYPGTSSAFSFERVINLGKPVLSLCFFNNILFAGLADGTIMSVDSSMIVPAHSAPVKALKNFSNKFLVSGSFDSTLKFWNVSNKLDLLHSITLPSKIYAMDLKDNFLCVALSDKSVITYNLDDMTQQNVFNTKFNYSIRSVGCHKDLDSFAVGSIEAKVEAFSRTNPIKRFIFRCHRVESRLYSVNVVRFYPVDSTFIITGGSDGGLTCFDKMTRSKICSFEFSSPVTAGEFSNDGKYFVFATGDDWSKGYTGVAVKPLLKMIAMSSVPGIPK